MANDNKRAAVGIHNLVFGCVMLMPVLLVPASGEAEQTFKICIGDRNDCQGPIDAFFLCGTSPDQAAASVCTKSTPEKQSIAPYSVNVISQTAGGRCGFATVAITCKN